MFTGIVTAIGTILKAEQKGDLHLTITCPFDPETIAIGASIACSGVCLTVVSKGGTAGNCWFSVDISAETLACTSVGMWHETRRLNLEPSLKLGDELGGHIVSGHVDAVGRIVSIRDEGDSHRFLIHAPANLAAFIAPKGSITVDGISLTVNSVEDQTDGSVHFGLNIIPHTAQVTTIGQRRSGDTVNLEIDTVARYLHRMNSLRS
ncbi:riboflavin synthase [Altericroceibacterium spongiae]|uniref:Riboflavin synthase n=1 Tax=Altericroceibacterium spongiae TaxID=2320269 RepID=A0A420EJC6_9SPHN|nr:riboflavin synthase [Altericroceibacterium spongiae]RKF20777.1 riboflavin synthase [Altericroceibacterium spongiae]